jgi:hypothetical protein
MSWSELMLKPKGGDAAPGFDAQQALRLQWGAASPLWMMYMGAAGAGLAFWSLSRWMNLAAPEAIVQRVGSHLRLVKPEPEAPVAAPPTPEPELKAAPKPVPAPIEAEVKAPPSKPEDIKLEPVKAEPPKAAAAPKPAPVKRAPKAAAAKPVAALAQTVAAPPAHKPRATSKSTPAKRGRAKV